MRYSKSFPAVVSAVLLLALPAARAAAAQEAAAEPLQVVATLPVLADLVREVGGPRVSVQSLSDPRQDPHYVQPTPLLMKRARDADAFVEVGLQLELWAQKVVESSGNPQIQQGQPGRIVASSGIPTLEVPEQVSRDWGHVHPYGNPHLWLDPLLAADMAANVAEGLIDLDPAHAEGYRARLKDFQDRVDRALFGEALVQRVGGSKLGRLAKQGRLLEYLERKELADQLGGWLGRAAPLRGRPIVTYHKTWVYFADRFGFQVPIEIEDKPGIPPSARHRDRVLELVGEVGVRTLLVAGFYDRTAADYLAERSGARVVALPIDVGSAVRAPDYFALIDRLVEELVSSETGS